jgi:hypothetical protein
MIDLDGLEWDEYWILRMDEQGLVSGLQGRSSRRTMQQRDGYYAFESFQAG